MKRPYICIILLLIFVCVLSSCTTDTRVDYRKMIEAEKIPEENTIEEVQEEKTVKKEEDSDYPFTEEELEVTLKTVIEDDIWFEEKQSIFYHCINQEIAYEYEYTRYDNSEDGYVTVLPLIEPNNQKSFYYILSLGVCDGKIEDGPSYSGMRDLEELRTQLFPEVTGRGTVSIGERRKPLYDTDEEDIERVKENILNWRDSRRTIGGGSQMEDIYIRNFYKNSIETIMFYTYKGKRCCCSVYLNKPPYTEDLMANKPYSAEDLDEDYVERMMECSFPLGELPPLDEEKVSSMKKMIEEKTEQKVKAEIEDNIWFGYEESIFYPYINQEIQYELYYEYYYIGEHGFIRVLPMIKPDRKSLYYVLGFGIEENILNHTLYISGENLNELKDKNVPEVLGIETVRIGERRKPPYDADEADIEEAKENIQERLEYEKKKGLWRDKTPDNNNEIYIRYFYKDSIDTIMIYTHKGKLYYVSVNLDGWRFYAPHAVEESQQEYFNRMLECSFPLYD